MGRGISKAAGGGSVSTAFSRLKSGNADVNNLSSLGLDVKKALFTTNGNSIKSQVATIESGNKRIDLLFRTDYNPLQATKPTKPIKTIIEATLWQDGNAVGIRTISKKQTKSLKSAQSQYNQILDDWKKITKQKSIRF